MTLINAIYSMRTLVLTFASMTSVPIDFSSVLFFILAQQYTLELYIHGFITRFIFHVIQCCAHVVMHWKVQMIGHYNSQNSWL